MRYSNLKLACLIVWALMFLGPARAAEKYSWNLNSINGNLGWQAGGQIFNFKLNETSLNFQSAGTFPYLISPRLYAFSDSADTVSIRMKTSVPGTGNIFWNTSYDPAFNQSKSLTFSLGKPHRFNNYYLNLKSQNPNWMGVINQLIINPSSAPGKIEIESITLQKGNLYTNLASAYQEFWGPKGRTVIGSSINLIPASTIWGRPVNIYLYWLFFIFFLIFFTVKFSQKPAKLKEIFRDAIQKTFILALAGWGLLTLNSDYNFLNIAKDNYARYSGKSLEQKRALVYEKEYYKFLVFAKENLPKHPVEFGVLSSKYAPELAARLYLIPHVCQDNPEKNFSYLLVFNPSPDQLSTTSNYALLAKLNDQAYILRRKK